MKNCDDFLCGGVFIVLTWKLQPISELPPLPKLTEREQHLLVKVLPVHHHHNLRLGVCIRSQLIKKDSPSSNPETNYYFNIVRYAREGLSSLVTCSKVIPCCFGNICPSWTELVDIPLGFRSECQLVFQTSESLCMISNFRLAYVLPHLRASFVLCQWLDIHFSCSILNVLQAHLQTSQFFYYPDF